jgi:hypothetical protein
MRFRDLIKPLNQAGIWTVYSCGHVAAWRLHRRIGDREFEISKSLNIENPEIAICDFAI